MTTEIPLILIIDDDVAWCELLTRVLVRMGYAVIYKTTGQSGLLAAREKRPRVILCDMNMPDGNGYFVARELKRDPALRDITLLAVSGSGLLETNTESVALGFDGMFNKSLDYDELLNGIALTLKRP